MAEEAIRHDNAGIAYCAYENPDALKKLQSFYLKIQDNPDFDDNDREIVGATLQEFVKRLKECYEFRKLIERRDVFLEAQGDLWDNFPGMANAFVQRRQACKRICDDMLRTYQA
jgi:hypothetical protein